jgi:hypothetical protein
MSINDERKVFMKQKNKVLLIFMTLALICAVSAFAVTLDDAYHAGYVKGEAAAMAAGGKPNVFGLYQMALASWDTWRNQNLRTYNGDKTEFQTTYIKGYQAGWDSYSPR